MIIGTVSYINTLPLSHYLPGTVVRLNPAQLSQALLDDKVDVAMVPLYTIIKHNLCMHPDAGIIACDGPAASVGFFTRAYIETLNQIRSVYMDTESKTSVCLAKIILKKFYSVSLYDQEFFHHDNRDKADAQVLIGDKALFYEKNSTDKFWDMGSLWKQHTNAGFMFACWASKRMLTNNELNTLIRAKELGLENRNLLVKSFEPNKQTLVADYFHHKMIYEPTPAIKEGLKLYRAYMKEYRYSEPWETTPT